MSSRGQVLKRKKIKLKHPNPLFEKWLEEWKNEAASKNSDTQYAFAKALQSLKKYPLPLLSGKECAILENFGTRICLLLDRKLTDYKKTNTVDGVVESPKELLVNHDPPKEKKARKSPKNTKRNSSKSEKTYMPTFRSASYAVLLALYQHLKKTGPPGELTKAQLQKASQPLCDTSMFKSLPGSYYSGWSCVGPLINKQLVTRRGNPHKFSLSESGIHLAEKLSTIDVNVPALPISPVTLPVVQPKPTFMRKTNAKKSRSESKTKITTEISQPLDLVEENTNRQTQNSASLGSLSSGLPSSSYTDSYSDLYRKYLPTSSASSTFEPTTIPDTGHNNIEDCLTQTSTSSSQVEEVILVPGTYKIVLLVDTQEIHKGDELVKELEAQGISPEVRNLKVGDFAWVSRNAIGQELLMPYIIERKRLDDLASSIKDGRFHEQKFRMKQSGVPHCMYLVESHGQRQYSLPTSTLLQAAANTQYIDRFTVKHTANSHETVVYLATFTRVLQNKFSDKTLIQCKKSELPTFNVADDCISLMSFKEFNKLSSKTRKYCVKEMFIKQLVQLRGLSVEKALAIVDRFSTPGSLMRAFQSSQNEMLLADIRSGNLNRKIGPAISKALFDLYTKSAFS